MSLLSVEYWNIEIAVQLKKHPSQPPPTQHIYFPTISQPYPPTGASCGWRGELRLWIVSFLPFLPCLLFLLFSYSPISHFFLHFLFPFCSFSPFRCISSVLDFLFPFRCILSIYPLKPCVCLTACACALPLRIFYPAVRA